jgi:hypothetical protein
MVKNILIIVLFIVALGLYTLYIQQPKATSNAISKPIQPVLENTQPIVEQKHPIEKKAEKTPTKLPKISESKNTIPSVNLKYYNLSLEKDYNTIYKKEKKNATDITYPPLITEEDTQEHNDLNFNLTPEINYHQETKEITIDGLQIQIEKKF